MRRLLALLLPVLLLLTACGGGQATPSASPTATTTVPAANAQALASVQVVDGGKGKAPKVTFDKPLAIKAEAIRVITKGTGAVVKDGQSVVLRQVAYNADTAALEGENFTKPAGQDFVFNANFKETFPLVYGAFVGATVGSYVAYATPATPAVAGSTAAPNQPAQPASVSVFYIESAKNPPAVMGQDDVKKLDAAGGLPTVTFDAKGVPGVTIPKKTAPADLVVKVLSEGTGAVVAESDTITANYTGWQWANGTKFDSSWDRGQPASFSLKQVISGWTKGLAGQKVGSKVLLVIPAAMAYGDSPSSGQPGGPLVFVVQIVSKK
ncbi:FKBP-type peptidyl-prolyl cis-trans isomerase [Specibacter cremeus]|uniref:FKBP-type peptidyl-prolyl cis-trans isomerase n=1 Tax=Specibacter cremeus TaxID=1629051 RepID=UPI000F7A904E|nr:FKBP-type peptidyl-prolyl cis-trans isomerase [Specibacter cremeus]